MASGRGGSTGFGWQGDVLLLVAVVFFSGGIALVLGLAAAVAYWVVRLLFVAGRYLVRYCHAKGRRAVWLFAALAALVLVPFPVVRGGEAKGLVFLWAVGAVGVFLIDKRALVPKIGDIVPAQGGGHIRVTHFVEAHNTKGHKFQQPMGVRVEEPRPVEDDKVEDDYGEDEAWKTNLDGFREYLDGFLAQDHPDHRLAKLQTLIDDPAATGGERRAARSAQKRIRAL